MKLIGEFKELVIDGKGNYIVSFIINDYRDKELIKQLEQGKYAIEIDKYKHNRSIEQNRLLWKLISEIDVKINGRSSDENQWSIYISALIKAGAKYDYVSCKQDMEQVLREKFRAVQYIKPFNDNGVNIYKVFYGSSKMNKKEFSDLVEAVKDIAQECGIEMSYWEEVLDVR